MSAATSSATPSKRKSAAGAGPFARRPSDSEPKRPRPDMSKAQGKRPELVDLTKPRSAFQPHSGAKKLVIKNLRTTSRAADLEQYYARTLEELDDALGAIFARRQPKQPFERLYRGVEDTCRNGRSRQLYERLHQRCEKYLNSDLLQSIRSEAGSSNVDMLRSVHKHWVIWDTQSVSDAVAATTRVLPDWSMLTFWN
jgi:cullin 4